MYDLDTQPNGLGVGVLGVGDINNDGFDDVAVGYFGQTAIYFGGDPMDDEPDTWLSKGIPRAFGDLNDDGYRDFVILQDTYASHDDTVWVYLGGDELDTIPDLYIPTDSTITLNLTFGRVCHIGGDLNNDGIRDLIITDFDARTPEWSTGKVYLYWGGEDLDNIADVTITGDSAAMALGWAVGTGDMNGDNIDDLVIAGKYSKPLAPDDSSDYDYIDIYLGNSEVLFEGQDYRIQKPYLPINESLGAYLTVFDYNSDGYADIITGNGYIFEGSAQLDTIADHFIDNPLDSDWLNKVGNVGDLNGDGYDDLGFGLQNYAIFSGYALFYLGGVNANTTNQPDAGKGSLISGGFGYSLDAAGDVNNDDVQDVIIAEPSGVSGGSFTICSGDTTLSPPMVSINTGYSPGQPGSFTLTAYPNPFNAMVHLQLEIGRPGVVDIEIFNILGQRIRKFPRRNYSVGKHTVKWLPSSATESGLYFARLSDAQHSKTIKVLYVK